MFDFAQFYTAQSVEDAVRTLAEDPAAVLIAGGTDVLLRIRDGHLANAHLVSIHGLPALTGVWQEADGTLVIGPATPFAALARDPLLLERFPMLCEAVGQVGAPQTREVGTIGGNLANGATSADSAPTLLAANAQLTLVSTRGTRTVPVTAFHTGPGRTVCARAELLTEIRIPPEELTDFAGCYLKYGKRAAMEIATLGCAVRVRLTPDKTAIDALRLAFGVAAPTPIRCPAAEAAAVGQPLTRGALRAIADAALTEVHPRTSWRASADFRLHLVHELTMRATETAVVRAGGALCEL